MTPVPDPRAKAIEAMARGMAREVRWRAWDDLTEGAREFYRIDAEAALAALEAEGLALTCTRGAERLRRALEVIAHPGLTPQTEPWSQEVARCALANKPHAALSSVPVEEDAAREACPTCGQPVRVVGEGTMHYEPAREAEKPCETCEGSGWLDRIAARDKSCPVCGGSGRTETKP